MDASDLVPRLMGSTREPERRLVRAVPEFVYRFRSIDKLLGKKELERCEIRLASPSELNDPMEGYKDVVFRGDEVLWENLLRHYILALVSCTINAIVLGDASSDEPDIQAALTVDDLPTDKFRKLNSNACELFFKHHDLSSLNAKLTLLREPLRREGVTFLLGLVHSVALPIVMSVMKQAGVMPSNTAHPPLIAGPLSEILENFSVGGSTDEREDFESFAFVANRLRDEQSLRSLLKFEQTNAGGARRLRYLLYTFPERYVQSLIEGLVHPSWHTACFSANCTDASMWGVYGDQHKGVALMFRTELDGERPFIPLLGVTGSSFVVGQPKQYVRGSIKGFLEKVAYSDRAPEVDFFQSLGNLPQGKLQRAWHTSSNGDRSKIVERMMTDLPAWREAYWDQFRRTATTKLMDWKHEEEYRFFISDTLQFGREPANRLVQYNLANLVGIVFGIRVSESHKIEVMKQTLALCKAAGRNDFTFHQMVYSTKLGRLVCV